MKNNPILFTITLIGLNLFSAAKIELYETNPALIRHQEMERIEAQKLLNEELFKAVENKDKSEILRLIKQGADINATGLFYNPFYGKKLNDTPLTYILKTQGHVDFVDFLLNNGADVNLPVEGVTPLMVALSGSEDAYYNLHTKISLLLDAGAKIQTDDKNNAIDFAKKRISIYERLSKTLGNSLDWKKNMYSEFVKLLESAQKKREEASKSRKEIIAKETNLPTDVFKIITSYLPEEYAEYQKFVPLWDKSKN